MKATLPATLLALATLASPLAHASGSNGDDVIDTRFAILANGNGWRRVFVGNGALDEKGIAFAHTSDGGFVTLISVPGGAVGSRIGLQRFGADGSVVTIGFGTGGRVVKDAYLITLTGMLIDHLGRIVVIGTTPGPGGLNDFGVVRFNADGSDDTSFGGDGGIAIGMEPMTSSSDDSPAAVIEQLLPGGARLVIAGNTLMQNLSGPLQSVALIGLRDDGSVDPDFGNLPNPLFDGRTLLSYAANKAAYATSLVKRANNTLIVAGSSVYNATDTDFGACYLASDGAAYVGSCSALRIDEPAPDGSLFDSVSAMALTAGDTVVLAGTASGYTAAVRLKLVDSALVLDPTFVGSSIPGRANRYVGDYNAVANDVAVRSDGSIVIVGRYIRGDGVQEGAVTRLLPSGAPDISFSPAGFAVYFAPLSGGLGYSSYTEFNKVLIDGGRPVLFGSSPDNETGMADFDGVMTRLNSDLIFKNGVE